MSAAEERWVLYPVCGAKTRLRLLRRTILQEFPLFCPKCRRESIINARNFQIEEVNQPDARTQCWPCLTWSALRFLNRRSKMKRTLVQKLGLLGLVGFFSYAAAVIFAPLA